MCAQVGPFMIAGAYVSIVIRGVGPIPVADADFDDIVDARFYFPEDNWSPQNGDDLRLLHAAASAINSKATALARERANVKAPEADVTRAPILYVQCQEGRSRSARCVGAFLMKYRNMTRQDALATLRAGYDHRIDGCDQELNEETVGCWLMQFVP
jgi:hypothetical protein